DEWCFNRLNSITILALLCPVGHGFGTCRDDMDDPVMVVAEKAQEGRQHGGGLRLGIVQQDDALAGDLQSFGEKFQFLRRRHRNPVACPQVGAEYGDAALLQDLQRRGRYLEKGSAEEWRARGGRGLSAQRRFNCRYALVDLANGLIRL